jgi:TM2 domain-containing membrane protein YozV
VYFVSQSEVERGRKSALGAALLALFLGSLGVHRFYLGRRASGTIILSTTVLSFGVAALVWIPFTIIESFQLAMVQERINKQKTRSTMQQQPSSRIPAQPEPQPAIAKSLDGIVIYDVSNIEPSRVTLRDSQDERPNHRKSYMQQPWTTQLELPYERHDMRVPQLRQATYEVYEQLAEYTDQLLRRQHSSLMDVVHTPSSGVYFHYNNILYTLFCIAEGEVTAHYSGGLRGYDNSFSYDILRERTNDAFVTQIERYATTLADVLPPADAAIREYFRLTENNLPITWWDSDGQLRKHSQLSKDQRRLLTITPSRQTKALEIPELRMAVFAHYFRVLDTLNAQRKLTNGWSQRMTNYLRDVFDSNRIYVNNPYDVKILLYLLKLSETAIRGITPYTRPLDATKETQALGRIIPKSAAQAVLTAVHDVQPLTMSDGTIALLRQQNPNAWKHDIADTSTLTLSQAVALLGRYKNPTTSSKIAAELAKKHRDPVVRLLALYHANTVAELNPALHKLLTNIIHPAQLATYRQLIVTKQPLSLALATGLAALQQQPRRRVVLDEAKLAQARHDHTRAVQSVVGYLNDNETPIPQPTEAPAISRDTLFADASPSPIVLTDDQRRFLQLVTSAADGVDAIAATEFARNQHKMLNSHIQAINKSLFDTFTDQVIIQRDGRIMIEDDYSVAVKELAWTSPA